MNGRIRLATPAQIVVLTLAWLGVCVGIDFTFNRHLWAGTAPEAPSTVPLSVRLHHLRCKGCHGGSEAVALRALPWLQGASMTVRETEPRRRRANFAGWLDIVVADAGATSTSSRSIRRCGRTASWRRRSCSAGCATSGSRGKVHHLCSPTTQGDCEPLPDPGQSRTERPAAVAGQPDHGRRRLHGRVPRPLQQPTDRIDVKELFMAMDEFGMLPSSLRPVVSAE